jgi:hypothetical protein
VCLTYLLHRRPDQCGDDDDSRDDHPILGGDAKNVVRLNQETSPGDHGAPREQYIFWLFSGEEQLGDMAER